MYRISFAAIFGYGLLLSACQQPDPIGIHKDAEKPKDSIPVTPAWTAPESSCTGEIPWPDIDWETALQHDSATSLAGDSLLTTYQYGGGCRTHSFTPICTDYHKGMTPGRATLWVRHSGSDDPCLALITQRLSFDAAAIQAKAGPGAKYRIRFLDEPIPGFVEPQGPPVAAITQAEAGSMATHSTHFAVERTRVSGDSLYVWVNHSGGCRDHQFPGYTSTTLYESNPPQVDFWIYHIDNQDYCKANVSRTLVYDVSALAQAHPGIRFRVKALTP